MTEVLNTDDVFVASARYVSADLSQEISQSVVILGLDDGIYYELTGAGARIWDLLQEPRAFSEIVSAILEEYDVGSARCESDLRALIRDLAARGMVCIAPAPSTSAA